MRLVLKNVGMIKEAEVKLDGLTVIAGENDTGKSTLLKTIFAIVKSDNISHTLKADEKRAKEILAIRLNLVFDANVSENGKIIMKDIDDNTIMDIEIENNNYVKKFDRNPKNRKRLFDATFIPSPIVFDFIDFFNSVARMRERQSLDFGLQFNIKYPYIMWDLYDKLISGNVFPKVKRQKDILEKIESIIKGKFVVEKDSKINYYKNIDGKVKSISMFNTAMGIKSFGILQLLNENRYLHPKYILLFDEPEVHLHPEWQLKMAELLVGLVNNGIKIVVTSHSPYMIDALKVYSNEKKITNNFYFIQKYKNNHNEKINVREVTEDLSVIFQVLTKPLKYLNRKKQGLS
ncbi:AAA family ATPase [Caminibacter sp.]